MRWGAGWVPRLESFKNQSGGILERINEPPWGRCLQGAADARWVVVVCCCRRRPTGGHFGLIVLRHTAGMFFASEAPRATTELSLGGKKSSRRDLSIPLGPNAKFALFLCFSLFCHQ